MLDRKVSWVIELSVGCAEGYFGSMFPGLAFGNEPAGHSPIALGRRRGSLAPCKPVVGPLARRV